MRGQRCRERFEGDAHHEKALHFLGIGINHGPATKVIGDHEPLSLEGLQCLAHDMTAASVTLGQSGFDQATARPEKTADDLGAQSADYLSGHWFTVDAHDFAPFRRSSAIADNPNWRMVISYLFKSRN